MTRLIVVSNRLPNRTPAAGGLAVALSSVLKRRSGLWVGWSGRHATEPDAELAIETVDGIHFGSIDIRRDDFGAYYAGFANRILWPAFHLRLDLARFEPAWYEGYRRVNTQFAAALREELRPTDAIWVHDYHLIPLGTELRRLGVRNRIGFYLHVPFPTPDALFAIPHHQDLLADLAAYDFIGLQANRDVAALKEAVDNPPAPTLATAASEPPDFSRTEIAAIPIGSDPDAFARLAVAPAAAKMTNRLRASLAGQALILGVDRLDYSKGLPQRIESYEKLLEHNAELRRHVRMLQIAPPSRDMIEEYRQITSTLDEAVGRVIGRFAEPDWQPLTYVKRSYGQATLAGLYRLARLGLVTPLRDGMNLVAHEYVAAQDPADPGVLVLSRYAGAAEIFGDALLVNPFDAEETAEAMRVGLAMPLEERRQRWRGLMAAARAHNVHNWAAAFLAGLLPDADVAEEDDEPPTGRSQSARGLSALADSLR